VLHTAVPKYCTTEPAGPAVLARAAYAFDIQSGHILYGKNADAQLPLASLTKVMTIATALSILSPTSTVTISADALSSEGDYGLQLGEKWRAGDLADFTLVVSANDGARALMLAAAAAAHQSSEQFYAAMNKHAAEWGLTQMYFRNETGLDLSPVAAGAYGSASDVAHLFSKVTTLYPSFFDRSVLPRHSFTSLSGVTHTVDNTSMVASSLMASSISKTGYTDLAGGNLGLVFEPLPGRPVAIAVLGSTREGRDSDVMVLANFVTTRLKRDILCQGTL
jgi:D-alanyl-D-alanine carboxypeptidase (penicillin-binding protein 5/6)